MLRHREEAWAARQRRHQGQVPRLPQRHRLGGTFNPNATCNAACIGDTAAFIAAFFPGGTFTCSLGYAGCKFNFEYSSPDKSLVFHHWQDKGTNGVSEQFTGDIANS